MSSSVRESLKDAGKDGALVIVRPSKLDAEGKTGIVAKGWLEKVEANKYNADKVDFFLRDEATNTLYIVNETKSLKEQLGDLPANGTVQIEIEYAGKEKTKNGKGYHNFECFVTGRK